MSRCAFLDVGNDTGPRASPFRTPLKDHIGISAETTRSVKERALNLDKKNAATKEKYKKAFENEINEKFENVRKIQKQNVSKWKSRTVKSPYSFNQFALAQNCIKDINLSDATRKSTTAREEFIRSMTGVPEHNVFCSDDFIKSMSDPELKMAFEYEKLNVAYSTVCDEESSLHGLIDEEFDIASRQFPALRKTIRSLK